MTVRKLFLTLITLSIFSISFLKAQARLDSGLVVHYTFDNTSLVDSTVNGYNWNINNMIVPASEQDRNGNTAGAIDLFNPSNTNTTNPTAMPSIHPVPNNWPIANNSRSISIWFRTDVIPSSGPQNYDFLFYQGGQSFNNGFGLAIGNNEVALVGYISDLIANTQITVGQWHHLLGTFNGVLAELYFDGILLNSANVNWNTTTGSIKLGHFGRSINSGGGSIPRYTFENQFFGAFDDLRLYDRVLNSNEITLLSGNVTNLNKAPQLKDKNRVLINPNPASNQINVEFDQDICSYSIYDIKGVLILQNEINCNSNFQINIESCSKGLHIINFKTQDGKVFLEKLIITD